MKKFKRIMALVIALAMVVAMALPSFAATSTPTTKGSIQMDTSADGSVDAAGKTFKAYKLFDVTYDGDNYAYTIPGTPANLLSTLATAFEVTAKDDNESDIAYNHRVVTAIETALNSDVEATAKTLLQAAKDADVSPITINGSTAATGLDLGYYVIEDATTSGDNQKPVSAIALTTTNPDVVIKVKATKPTLEKKIDEGTADAVEDDDSTEDVDESKPAVTAKNGILDVEDPAYDVHNIGDNVPYILRTTIPEMTGYTKYFFNVTDTLSKGLTFKDDVVIKVTKAAYTIPAYTDEDGEHEAEEVPASTRTLARGTDYTVTPTTNADGTTTIEIVFKDFYTKEKDHAGEEMIITYSADVNADAVIGVAGNPNTATLIYSHDPNAEQEPDDDNEDKPKDIDVMGKTPDQKTYTYVTGLKLSKVDGSTQNPLAGATFELSGNLNKVEVLKAEKYVEDENGTFFALTDGTYTTTDPTTLDKNAENYDTVIATYVDATGATKFKKTTVTEKTASGDPKAVSETTDSAGKIIFDGMGDGTFTLTETGVPTGYNELETPISFKVNWTPPTAPSTDCTWTVSDVTAGYSVTYDSTSGEFLVTVENNHGTILPSTGGIGTTIFYVVGAILVIGAGVVLITRRRMDA